MQKDISAKTPNLVGDTINAITRHIREKELMPADRLPSEATLSKELDVSRSVVREAFRSLAAMRIIELNEGKRATVAQIDYSTMSLMIEHGVHTEQITVQQIYDVRRTIEARIVALATIRRSPAQAKNIMALAKGMRANFHQPEELMEQDLSFHLAIATASHNPVFTLIVGAFQGITRKTWPIGWKSRVTHNAREAMLVTHEKIAQAILDGNVEQATHAMTLHFDESISNLVAAGIS